MAGGALLRFYKKYELLIGCGIMIVGSHVGWRWLQDQPNVRGSYEVKEYPWWEFKRLFEEEMEKRRKPKEE